MSMNPHVRIGLSVLGSLAIGSCSSASSDATGPGDSPPTVTLTASQTHVTAPGDIILSASATDVNGPGVQKVEFYEQVSGVDATPRKIGEDFEAPYEMSRSILGIADNGDRAFSAKGYDVAGHVGVSNTAMVTIAVASDPTPFQASVSASPRITTPGHINFRITANKTVAKAEVYVGTTKIAEVIAPTAANPASVSVTQADNGTHAYVVKVYDSEGKVVESAPITVEVDIRWDFVLPIEGIRSHDPPLIATDATGAVYYAGGTETWGVFLVKYDADGNRLWIRNFGGGGVDHPEHPKSVGVDASGRVFLVGTAGNGNRGYDCFLALYDASGSLLRAQVVDLPGVGYCFAASDASGSIYIAGSADDLGQGFLFLIKYDGGGSVLWTQRFGGTPVPPVSDFPNDALTSIAIDPLGGVYVGGYTGQSFDGAPNRGPRDLFIVKFDADGNRLWSRQYGTAGLFTFALSLAADPDGGAYFAGYLDPRVTYNTGVALLVRYSSDGTLRWARTLDAGGDVVAWGVAADQRGVYLVGHTNRSGRDQLIEPLQGGYDAFLAQFTRDGDPLAVRLLGTPASEFGSAVAIGVNGDAYVAAWTVYDQGAAIFTPFLARHRDP